MKLRIHPDTEQVVLLQNLTERYKQACNFVSQYVFDHGFNLDYQELQKELYPKIRFVYGLKAQMTISVLKTVVARYKAVQEQLHQNPYVYKDEQGKKHYIQRTLEWLVYPICFKRPQADLVRSRDYCFTAQQKLLSLNTLEARVKVTFDMPKVFQQYFDGTWKFGTGKIVYSNHNWYFHIPMTKQVPDMQEAQHVVGIDRGLRFLATTYDEQGKTTFYSGKTIMDKRAQFQAVRSELQAKSTKSAKRALKRISGRENRYMADVNHQLSKTLVQKYGPNTLFVLEDLTGVSFDEQNLKNRASQQKQDLRTWAFYQLEFFLTYKAHEIGSEVLKVQPDYTSQRCAKCGRIHKANRHSDIHEYICDCCGYRTNDDRNAAMNIQLLDQMYLAGMEEPSFRTH